MRILIVFLLSDEQREYVKMGNIYDGNKTRHE